MPYIKQKGSDPVVVLIDDIDGIVVTGSVTALKKHAAMTGVYKGYFEIVDGELPENISYLKYEV